MGVMPGTKLDYTGQLVIKHQHVIHQACVLYSAQARRVVLGIAPGEVGGRAALDAEIERIARAGVMPSARKILRQPIRLQFPYERLPCLRPGR